MLPKKPRMPCVISSSDKFKVFSHYENQIIPAALCLQLYR